MEIPSSYGSGIAADPMLSPREATAFLVAPATAPVIAAVFLGSPSPWPLVAVVAYVAAFVLGAPLFAYLRHRAWPLASRCLCAGALAGLIAALVLVISLLLGFSVERFIASPENDAVFVGVGAAWGVGLGLGAGLTLFALLRERAAAKGTYQSGQSNRSP